MSPDKQSQERRRHPRLLKSVPIKICRDDGDLVTKTLNISRSGAYCQVEKFIDPMTKLKIHLLVPVKKGAKTSTKKISCQGAVVRTEKAGNFYNVAVFFSDISQRDADLIAEYVSYYLEHQKKETSV